MNGLIIDEGATRIVVLSLKVGGIGYVICHLVK